MRAEVVGLGRRGSTGWSRVAWSRGGLGLFLSSIKRTRSWSRSSKSKSGSPVGLGLSGLPVGLGLRGSPVGLGLRGSSSRSRPTWSSMFRSARSAMPAASSLLHVGQGGVGVGLGRPPNGSTPSSYQIPEGFFQLSQVCCQFSSRSGSRRPASRSRATSTFFQLPLFRESRGCGSRWAWSASGARMPSLCLLPVEFVAQQSLQ